MGRASRRKREQREFDKQDEQEWTDLVVQAGVATASGKGGDT